VDKNIAAMAANIKKHLDKKRWNQSDLARELNIKPQQLSRWLSGKTPPGLQNVIAIANALGTTPSVLLDTGEHLDHEGAEIHEVASRTAKEIKAEIGLLSTLSPRIRSIINVLSTLDDSKPDDDLAISAIEGVLTEYRRAVLEAHHQKKKPS
jgi:transcriptional regulator with XRE-family HTH domain